MEQAAPVGGAMRRTAIRARDVTAVVQAAPVGGAMRRTAIRARDVMFRGAASKPPVFRHAPLLST